MALVIDSTTLDLSLLRRATTADVPVREPKPAAPASSAAAPAAAAVPAAERAPAAPAERAAAGASAPSFSTAALDRLGAAMRDVFQRFEAPLGLFFDGDDGEAGAAARTSGSLQFSASRVELAGDGFRLSASAFSFSWSPAAAGAASSTTKATPVVEADAAAGDPAAQEPPAASPSPGSAAPAAEPNEDPRARSAPAPISASPAAPTPASVATPAESEALRARSELSMARGDTRVRVRSRASEPAEREAPRRSERGGTASRFSAELRARSSETRFTLDLVTADGDLVRIDFSSLESRLRLRGAAFGEDGLLAAFAGRDRGSVRELAFEVQGELDDEELAQLREFVRDVLKTGRRALRDDGDAFARLARQGVEASEIASFALDYRRTETKLLAKYRTVAGAGNEAAAPASLDADSARAVGRLADEARSLTDQGSRVLLRASAETLVARVLGEAVKPVQVPAEELAEEAVAAALDGGPEPAAAPASASEAAPADDD
jgi:hypothetical protein